MLALAYGVRFYEMNVSIRERLYQFSKSLSNRFKQVNIRLELIFYSQKQPTIEIVGTGWISTEMHKFWEFGYMTLRPYEAKPHWWLWNIILSLRMDTWKVQLYNKFFLQRIITLFFIVNILWKKFSRFSLKSKNFHSFFKSNYSATFPNNHKLS